MALAAALVAAASDSGIAGVRLPVHRRQVNERWLDRYRPWVYGAGFGWQIGTGLATYITSAAVYLTVVLGALTGRPALALSLGTGFGFLRGMAVLLTRDLADPSELRAFHRRFLEVGPLAGRLVIGAELASAAVMAAWLRSPAALAVVALAAGVAGGGGVVGTPRGGGRSARARCPRRPGRPRTSRSPVAPPPRPPLTALPGAAGQPSAEPREGAVDGTGAGVAAPSPRSLRSSALVDRSVPVHRSVPVVPVLAVAPAPAGRPTG